MLTIATWNINSIRLRLGSIKRFIETYNPDIICFQEIKVINELFPSEFFEQLNYKYLFYSGQKSYNGVAIISRLPMDFGNILKFFNNDKRHISIKIQNIEIHNFYVPAGGDIPDTELNPKFKHKLAYIDLMQNWFKNNKSDKDNIILLGDLNIAPYEHDVWSSKALRYVVSHTDIERATLESLRNSFNFIDSSRYFIPMDQKHYTWWSYRNIDWQKSDRGRRLDHIWVSSNIAGLMQGIDTCKETRSWELPSDHVPYILKVNMVL